MCRVVCRGMNLILRRSPSQGWVQAASGAERPGCRRQYLVLTVRTFPVAAAVAGHSWRWQPGWTDNWSDTVAVWMFMSTSCSSNALTDVCFSVPLLCFHLLESGSAVSSSALLCMYLPHCASLLLRFAVWLPHGQLSLLGIVNRLGDWCLCRDPLCCHRCKPQAGNTAAGNFLFLSYLSGNHIFQGLAAGIAVNENGRGQITGMGMKMALLCPVMLSLSKLCLTAEFMLLRFFGAFRYNNPLVCIF